MPCATQSVDSLSASSLCQPPGPQPPGLQKLGPQKLGARSSGSRPRASLSVAPGPGPQPSAARPTPPLPPARPSRPRHGPASRPLGLFEAWLAAPLCARSFQARSFHTRVRRAAWVSPLPHRHVQSPRSPRSTPARRSRDIRPPHAADRADFFVGPLLCIPLRQIVGSEFDAIPRPMSCPRSSNPQNRHLGFRRDPARSTASRMSHRVRGAAVRSPSDRSLHRRSTACAASLRHDSWRRSVRIVPKMVRWHSASIALPCIDRQSVKMIVFAS